MAIAEISIVPVGTGTTSVSSFVADAVTELTASGLTYQLTPMGTIIEGELEQVMAVCTRMHAGAIAKGARRVYTTIKIDDRRDGDEGPRMEHKVASVKQKLKKQIR
jgi:uncharacterized protein (TIGR00106 family)